MVDCTQMGGSLTVGEHGSCKTMSITLPTRIHHDHRVRLGHRAPTIGRRHGITPAYHITLTTSGGMIIVRGVTHRMHPDVGVITSTAMATAVGCLMGSTNHGLPHNPSGRIIGMVTTVALSNLGTPTTHGTAKSHHRVANAMCPSILGEGHLQVDLDRTMDHPCPQGPQHPWGDREAMVAVLATAQGRITRGHRGHPEGHHQDHPATGVRIGRYRRNNG